MGPGRSEKSSKIPLTSYAWDEALEDLYTHIYRLVSFLHTSYTTRRQKQSHQETRVIDTSNTVLTQVLHVIHAHQMRIN